MTRFENLVERNPVLCFVALSYAITWGVWFSIPLFADEWGLVKVLTGVGIGPGLAAVLLDRIRGTAGPITSATWRTAFAIVFVLVVAINVSTLLTGDAGTPAEFANAHPVGIGAIGVIGSLLTAVIAAFVFASALCSRSPSLSSIGTWRAPLRWWLVALFLVAAMTIAGRAITWALGGDLPASPRGELETTTWAWFVARSVLFTFLVVAVGEETGWRGWMLPELQKRYSPLVSSLLLGVVWGFWHFPLFFIGLYVGGPVGIVGYLILCPMLAVNFTWLYNHTAGNLLLAMVLHTAINNTGRIVSGTQWTVWMGVALMVLVIFIDRMWRPLQAREGVGAAQIG